jgi:hypothetical protein
MHESRLTEQTQIHQVIDTMKAGEAGTFIVDPKADTQESIPRKALA